MLSNNQKILHKHATVHGNPIVASNWSYTDGRLISEKKAEKIYNQCVKELVKKKHKGEIALLFLLADKNGQATKWKNMTEFKEVSSDLKYDIDTELDEYWGKKVKEGEFNILKVQIQLTQYNKPSGGQNNKNNDCLYECLEKLIPNILSKVFPTPESLKTFCGLQRNSLIPIKKIKDIENKLPNCKINVNGEYIYNSTKDALYTINLRLSFEHYDIMYIKINSAKGISPSEKKPLVFKYSPTAPKYAECYNGKKIGYIKLSILREWQKKPSDNNTPYMVIRSDGSELKDQYENFCSNADIVKELTNGKYNLYKCGNTKRLILNRFYELNPCVIPDIIKQSEAEWILNCHRGGLVWVKKGYKGEAWKYDINSAYPYVISHHLFSFPIKKGTFKKLTQDEFNEMEYYEFGIYRVKIYGDYRHIPLNKEYYVHYDLERARELGYKIELIEDDNANFLSYSGSNMRVNGTIFKEIVNELYEHKKKYGKQYPIFKTILLLLWGSLCERNKTSKYIFKEDNYNVPDDMKCLSMKKIGKNLGIKMININNQFTSGFARLGPFLASRVRCMMSRVIEKDIDNIVRVYIDGIISTKELKYKKINARRLDNVKIGTDLGDLKYEGYNPNIHIHNHQRVEGLREFI
jgi:hypothetical protein